ncbi:hypothetical protein FACS1894113_3470 [Alphaproteobacteria bacterium]|nr:hypothetical protein FACS1894113_3470 [Alphaproteobacteria bacterium]
MAMIEMPIALKLPKIFSITTAYGALEFANELNPTTPIIETVLMIYTNATQAVPMIIARGIVFFGSLTLSAGVVALSRPMKPQKVNNAVCEIDKIASPLKTADENLKCDGSKNMKKMIGKISNGTIFMAARTVSSLPENLTPTMFASVTASKMPHSINIIDTEDSGPVIVLKLSIIVTSKSELLAHDMSQ